MLCYLHLINDRDRYIEENPKIKSPDLIIVSGDIIRGSTNITNSQTEVQHQYSEAIDFLNQLANHFVNGDKERIVLIPGNHDVDWRCSKESMTKLDSGEVFESPNRVKTQYLKEAISHHSDIRWSWGDLSFYKVSDKEKYHDRLKAFSEFYSTFYDEKKQYSLKPEEQYDIFDYPNFNLTIVAFNSCYSNDHLRLAGDIHPDCIANANLKLRELRKKGRLILATWHHNTKGLPYEFNYMDNSKLKSFIDSGISLGFHGHQHRTELIHEYSNAIEQKRIVVFSAGTLCGGPNELPTGNNRQYNLIELNWTKSNSIGVTLHIREKTETSSFDNPIWHAGRIDSNLISYHNIEIEKPQIKIEVALMKIELVIKQQNYADAKQQLLKLDPNNDYVRKYLLECIIQTEDHVLAMSIFSSPKNTSECVTLLSAAYNSNDKEAMRASIDTAKHYNSIDPSIKELVKKIETRLSL